MALIANVNRDPKKGRAAKPKDFNPYLAKDANDDVVVLDQKGMHELKPMFEGLKNGKNRRNKSR